MITLRPFDASDAEDVLHAHRRSEAFDGVPRVFEADELLEELGEDSGRWATDTRVALWNGEVVGYAYTMFLPSEVKELRCYLFGQVDPGFRGRGIGTELLRWAQARGTDQLRSAGGSLPKYLRVLAMESNAAAHRLFQAEDFEVARYMDELLRPLVDLPAPGVPDDIRIRPWPSERDDEIRRVKDEAFADHWGTSPETPESWERRVHGYGSRPDLSFVAVDPDDRVIGHCLNCRYESDDELLGRRDAWIDNLGTLRAWRGRGVASALISHSLHAFEAAGCTHASIEVDSDNPTGAARLYRALGFEPQNRWVVRQIVVDPG